VPSLVAPRGPWKNAGVRRLGNALLALASVALTLMLLEGVARVARAIEGRRQGPGTEFSAYSEYDPLLGWRKRPEARVTFRRREYTVPIAINARGLRDPERGYAAQPGTRRILALGDSFVEGYTVPLGDTVTQVLEASLRKDCRVDVINGATTGYSTDQEELFYETEGVRYHPGIVLLFFYYNDVIYNDSQWYYGGVPKPVFVFRDGALQVWKRPVPTPTPTPTPAATPPPEAEPTGPRLAERSALAGWVRERLWFGAPRLYNRLGRLGLWPPNRPMGPRTELAVYSRQRIPEIESGWEKTEAILERLAGRVHDHGARLLVVYVPSRMEINDRAWQLSQVKYAMDEATWDRGLVLLRLEQIAAAAGIPVLDLTPALRKADGLLAGPYYVEDGHWNARGHRVAAREVRRFLFERDWLSGCRSPTL
jgi:SGNH hydrolase-like domain, acetyltransferase AlgX/GDSL-like Lipase/Acylhydrolase